MFLGNLRYWICQLIGWGGWTLFYLLFTYQFAYDAYWRYPALKERFLYGIIADFIFFIIITHLLRYLLKKANWMQFIRGKLVLIFLLGTVSTTAFHSWVTQLVPELMGKSMSEYRKGQLWKEAKMMEEKMEVAGTTYYLRHTLTPADSLKRKAFDRIKRSTGWYRNEAGVWQFNNKFFRSNIWWGVLIAWLLISLWLLIYMMIHYLERVRKAEVDQLKLESTVKELELKTIKAHINPHFIFNSLNSIRALVDENPERARRAITELSNILRSSMHAEKLETTPLERELDIVKDYLALEQMRFEDRLKIEYHIDEDTLDQQVPPMMVQTLVENAIKHGISKLVNGGVVKIHSDFINNYYELRVLNTGTLNHENLLENGGFGLKSTQDRLKLLFGPDALFSINETGDNMVEVKVQLPVKINDK